MCSGAARIKPPFEMGVGNLAMKVVMVYALFSDGTSRLVSTAAEAAAHEGMFGVKKAEWLHCRIEMFREGKTIPVFPEKENKRAWHEQNHEDQSREEQRQEEQIHEDQSREEQMDQSKKKIR